MPRSCLYLRILCRSLVSWPTVMASRGIFELIVSHHSCCSVFLLQLRSRNIYRSSAQKRDIVSWYPHKHISLLFACACLLTSFVLGLANSCAMQLITEIPSDFAARFTAMCSSGVESQLAVARPLNLKDSARFLVEEVLSGFPGLVSTDSLEVSAHRVSLLPHSWNASYERFCRH